MASNPWVGVYFCVGLFFLIMMCTILKWTQRPPREYSALELEEREMRRAVRREKEIDLRVTKLKRALEKGTKHLQKQKMFTGMLTARHSFIEQQTSRSNDMDTRGKKLYGDAWDNPADGGIALKEIFSLPEEEVTSLIQEASLNSARGSGATPRSSRLSSRASSRGGSSAKQPLDPAAVMLSILKAKSRRSFETGSSGNGRKKSGKSSSKYKSETVRPPGPAPPSHAPPPLTAGEKALLEARRRRSSITSSQPPPGPAPPSAPPPPLTAAERQILEQRRNLGGGAGGGGGFGGAKEKVGGGAGPVPAGVPPPHLPTRGVYPRMLPPSQFHSGPPGGRSGGGRGVGAGGRGPSPYPTHPPTSSSSRMFAPPPRPQFHGGGRVGGRSYIMSGGGGRGQGGYGGPPPGAAPPPRSRMFAPPPPAQQRVDAEGRG